MKKVLFSLLTVGLMVAANAQVISFEGSEGFAPGDINGQSENWTSTPIDADAGQYIPYQDIVSDMSSEGSQSLKISYIEEYGQQDGYIIGAIYTPAEPIPFETGFTVEYDFYGTALDLSDFTFQLVDFTQESYLTFLDFSYDGTVIMAGDDGAGGGQLHPSTGTWESNNWYTLKMEYQEDGLMHLFLNDVEVSTGLPYLTTGNVEAIRLFTDNWGGDGYYDNIRINQSGMGVNDLTLSSGSIVYPNPAKDVVNIQLAEGFDAANTTVTLTSVTGKKAAQFANVNNVNVSNLPAGVYVMTITDGKKTETKKLIKK